MEQIEIETIEKTLEMLDHMDYSNMENVIDNISIVSSSLNDMLANSELRDRIRKCNQNIKY
jgi:hypothetical protein